MPKNLKYSSNTKQSPVVLPKGVAKVAAKTAKSKVRFRASKRLIGNFPGLQHFDAPAQPLLIEEDQRRAMLEAMRIA